jgi:hypothetical protein
MKIDNYTKFILTVIACCLLWLCFTNSPPTVKAQAAQHVIIDDVNGLITGSGLPVYVTKPVETKAAH